jgi:iron complex transport system substrate-binding protein
MLGIAGGVNVFADVPRESVQPSSETLLVRAPEAIVEVRVNPMSPDVLRQEREVWSVLPSIPAVRARRIHFLSGDYLFVPGPRVGRATEAFAKALHPEVFQ